VPGRLVIHNGLDTAKHLESICKRSSIICFRCFATIAARNAQHTSLEMFMQ
jgi:hypothetical protein